jgi:hypothetical protein
MVLYLKMDQKTWSQGDFTDSATYDLSGTVYDENTFTTVRDISSFTGTFRLIDPSSGDLIFSSDSNLTLNSNGTFTMKFSTGKTPVSNGNTKVRLLLKISGSRITCIGVNGSDELFLEFD